MVGVAQLVEHFAVAEVVVGSNPIAHPPYNILHPARQDIIENFLGPRSSLLRSNYT